jgi:hypothetical protein
MKVYGGVDVQIHIFLTSALAGGEWSSSRPGRFIPGERVSSTHWIGGWLDSKVSLFYELYNPEYCTLQSHLCENLKSMLF